MDGLREYLVRQFDEELKKVMDREAAEPGYLPQDDFNTCLERSSAAMAIASERPRKTLALATAYHRSLPVEAEGHGEDRSEEITELVESDEITTEDNKFAKKAWWAPPSN